MFLAIGGRNLFILEKNKVCLIFCKILEIVCILFSKYCKYIAKGTLEMYDGTITECEALGGGGIGMLGSAEGTNQIIIHDGNIIENKATDTTFVRGGGGIYVAEQGSTGYYHNRSLEILGGVISNNEAGYPGGGIFINDRYCAVSIAGGMIKENRAKMGGGFYSSQMGSVTLKGGEITQNHTTSWGGGMMLAPVDVLYLEGPVVIRDNTSEATAMPAHNLFIQGNPMEQNKTKIDINGDISGGEIWIPTNFLPSDQPEGKLYMIASTADHTITEADRQAIFSDQSAYHVMLDDQRAEIYFQEHDFATEWSWDDDSHWYACTVCEAKKDENSHDFGSWEELSPTETTDGYRRRTCNTCLYLQEIRLPALNTLEYRVELPLTLTVQKTGTAEAEGEIFHFTVIDTAGNLIALEEAPSFTVTDWDFQGDTATESGILHLKFKGNQTMEQLKNGITVEMEEGNAEGWIYAIEQWKVTFQFSQDPVSLQYAITDQTIVEVGHIIEEPSMLFTLSYEKPKDGGDGGSSGGGNTSYYILQYHTNGGNGLNEERKSTTWTKAYEKLPIPVREGYIFAGWYLDKELTQKVKGDVAVNVRTVHLYAKWKAEEIAQETEETDSGVMQWLNGEEHNAYLFGYTDGTFRPDRPMTRAEAAQMFYNLLLEKEVPFTVTFIDVPENAWYSKAVHTLASLGMLGGRGNGIFDPEGTITRAEFTSIAMNFSDKKANGAVEFTDVQKTDWFYRAVTGAVGYGWISGYGDGTFRPEQTITRGEAAAIVNQMLHRQADRGYVTENGLKQRFSDLTESHWAYWQVLEAAVSHQHIMQEDGEVWADNI